MTVDHTELRAWLEANCPPKMREPPGEDDICWGGRRFMFRSEAQKLWLERCVARGLTVPTWPNEYGGAGFAREDAAILKEEKQRIYARPPLGSFGIWMLGPALLKFGSPEQKATHLPRIARGETRWCQGYSEPGAGSDLASLRTKAEDRGDHFLVSGQKIWTSYADKADWIFCLVRTDPQAVKQKGISFLLIDMATPGVSLGRGRASRRPTGCRGSRAAKRSSPSRSTRGRATARSRPWRRARAEAGGSTASSSLCSTAMPPTRC